LASIISPYLITARGTINGMHQRKKRFPRPYIDFVNNSNFNAFATRYDRRYFIAVNKGTLQILSNVFSRLLANKNTFTYIGNPSIEATPDKIPLSEIYDQREFYTAKSIIPVPIDSIRKLYTEILITWAYKYIILHEYGHILAGHVGYSQSHNHLPIKEVRDPSSVKFLKPLDGQTIEMDADSYATTQTIESLLYHVQNPRLIPENLRRFYVNWQTALRMWLTAIYTQWRLLSYLNVDSDIQTTDHPLPAIRTRLILATIDSIFDLRYKAGLEHEIADISADALKDVENAFDQVSTSRLDYSDIKFMYSEGASRQFMMIMNNYWNHLRPLLKDYSFFSEAKPRLDK
jgi:hypothetical protein